jgi:hypothetical protein
LLISLPAANAAALLERLENARVIGKATASTSKLLRVL